MKRYISLLEEEKEVYFPKIGDSIKFGKFKNKSATIQEFSVDDNGHPIVITDKGKLSLYHFRIDKLMK